jgi:hypothetical protein
VLRRLLLCPFKRLLQLFAALLQHRSRTAAAINPLALSSHEAPKNCTATMQQTETTGGLTNA